MQFRTWLCEEVTERVEEQVIGGKTCKELKHPGVRWWGGDGPPIHIIEIATLRRRRNKSRNYQ